jgi:predicted NACHT family NTPase
MPHNVILIFDGLDELNVNDDTLDQQKTVDSHNEVTDIFAIFRQLLEGVILPGVNVLTTSRPTAEKIYKSNLKFDRNFEIMGFDEDQIKKYVEMFCSNDKERAAKMWDFINKSPELLSLCYLPVNCYIVCLTLKESIGNDEREEAEGVPRTITELYKRAIKGLLYRHHLRCEKDKIPKDYVITKLPEQLQNELEKFKEIARVGMMNDKITFEFGTGDELLVELSSCGLFNKLEDQNRNIFSFLHLSIQEFLAALHVVDDMENVETFLSEHIDDPKWHLVIQFVSGLIGDIVKEEMKNLQGYVPLIITILYTNQN